MPSQATERKSGIERGEPQRGTKRRLVSSVVPSLIRPKGQDPYRPVASVSYLLS